MRNYFIHNAHISDDQKWRLVQSGIQGAARDVLSGYKEKHINSPSRIFKVLRREFKRRQLPAVELHGLQQGKDEKVIMFAARVRKHIADLGIAKRRKADRACLHFFKIGALANIQARLNSTDPYTFKSAIRIAQTAESEKTQKQAFKTTKDTLNTIKEVEIEKASTKTEVAELCNVIRQLIAKPTTTRTEPQHNYYRPQNDYPSPNAQHYRAPQYSHSNRKCYHCQKIGHSYMYCRNARDSDKQAITKRIRHKQDSHQNNKHEQKTSNFNVAPHDSQGQRQN